MEITEVRVFNVGEEKLKAYASIVFDDCFIINDLKIIQGRSGLFISMPSRRRKRGGYRDVAHPLNNGTRRQIEEEVLAEYERMVEGGGVAEERPLSSPEVTGETAATEGSPPAVAGRRPPLAPERDMTGTSREEADAAERSLEEMQDLHLDDSFWSVS